jgi:hypothetical protein
VAAGGPRKTAPLGALKRMVPRRGQRMQLFVGALTADEAPYFQ